MKGAAPCQVKGVHPSRADFAWRVAQLFSASTFQADDVA